MAFWRLAFLALFWGGISGAASAQAIDCASTTLNHSERAVCASETLRSLAASMDRRYSHLADTGSARHSQLEWTGIRDRCNGNLACLTTAYRERNAYLARLPAITTSAAAAPDSTEPVKHLFLRHAPAQLLSPAPSALPAEPASASERLNRAAGPATPAISQTPRWNTLWVLVGLLSVSILLWQMLTNVCGKCPNCHHWFARVEIDRRQLASDATRLSTRRRLIPRSRAVTDTMAGHESGRGHVAAVRHYHQCRMCLHEWETITQEAK
ncbi:hypothetical protein [Rhodanobacter sp. BL-MT-08]